MHPGETTDRSVRMCLHTKKTRNKLSSCCRSLLANSSPEKTEHIQKKNAYNMVSNLYTLTLKEKEEKF